MTFQNSDIIELTGEGYVPVIKDSTVYYGGSQMWFPADRWFSKNYVIHNYGCGTIAAADLLLYLALRNEEYRNPLTESAFFGTNSAYYKDYLNYVSKINDSYTRTKRFLAVLGTGIASALNDYAYAYGYKYHAKWEWSLSYYDMLDAIEEMLSKDIPVILSIGPNTPFLWGKKGIGFYQQYEAEKVRIKNDLSEPEASRTDNEIDESHNKICFFRKIMQNINSHYVTVTGLLKCTAAASVMLRISSWGKQYYINYEEYREYINEVGGTFTSSIVYIK